MAQQSVRKSACALVGVALFACDEAEPAITSAPPLGSNAAGAPSVGAQSSALPHQKLDLSPPRPEPSTLGLAAASHAIGERAESRDYFMTLLRATSCDVEPHFRPARGRIKLGVEVLIEAKGAREVPANPFLATLRDAEDRDYQADVAGCTPTLGAARLAQNDQARGFITFEIPADATGLTMTYAPFVVGVGPEELTFALGR